MITKFFTLLFTLFFSIFSCFVSYAGVPSYSSLPDTYITKDNYTIDEKGDVYYFPDYSEAFKGGIADDGYAYDEEGRQINSLTYILDKYSGRDFICFDSEYEMHLYITACLLTYGDVQGDFFTYDYSEGKPRLSKKEVDRAVGSVSADYVGFIKEKASEIDPSLSSREKISEASNIAMDAFEFDSSYTSVPLEKAVADGRGVCFHYVRVLEDILTELGIESEPFYGLFHSLTSTHTWLRAWDGENETWIYLDPTSPSSPATHADINMKRYFTYRQAAVKETETFH